MTGVAVYPALFHMVKPFDHCLNGELGGTINDISETISKSERKTRKYKFIDVVPFFSKVCLEQEALRCLPAHSNDTVNKAGYTANP